MKILVDWRLWTHPKLLALARSLGRNRAEAGGLLVTLWGFTAEYRPSGSLAGLSDEDIADGAGWRGAPGKLVTALREHGWLDGSEVHDWEEHQGKYIRRLMHERDRKKKEYQAGVSAEKGRSLRGVSEQPSPSPLTDPSPSPLTGQDRREKPPPPPPVPEKEQRPVLQEGTTVSGDLGPLFQEYELSGGPDKLRTFTTWARACLAAGVTRERISEWMRNHRGMRAWDIHTALVEAPAPKRAPRDAPKPKPAPSGLDLLPGACRAQFRDWCIALGRDPEDPTEIQRTIELHGTLGTRGYLNTLAVEMGLAPIDLGAPAPNAQTRQEATQ